MALTRAKFGYLAYDEITERISKGELDAYDIVYTKDTHENILITPELTTISIKSKVYCFDGIDAAEIALNALSDTYEGQIVSIRSNKTYSAYIVNKNENEQYYVSALADYEGDIDYNKLGNRPIINLVGDLDNPIIVCNLNTGIYTIKGQYQILGKEDETIYLSAVSNIFLIEKTVSATYIKKISTKEISTYTIGIDGDITTDKILTEEYLNAQGYITESYIDIKLEAMNYVTEDEVESYVENVVIDRIDAILDERLDAKLAEKQISDNQISDLF